MPYPDDFKGLPKEISEREYELVGGLEQCYRDILTGIIAACVKNRVHPDKRNLGGLIESVREFIGEAADEVLETDIRVLYDTEEQDKDRTYAAIVDSFRVKPLDYTKAFNEVFRPAATNPATIAVNTGMSVQFIEKE